KLAWVFLSVFVAATWRLSGKRARSVGLLRLPGPEVRIEEGFVLGGGFVEPVVRVGSHHGSVIALYTEERGGSGGAALEARAQADGSGGGGGGCDDGAPRHALRF